MGIPENLKALRTAAALSQPELARKAGVSQQLISQLENGRNLSTKYLPQIARALGVEVAEIDSNYAVTSPEDIRDELSQIYRLLEQFPDLQTHLLEHARRLKLLAQSAKALPTHRPPNGE